MIENFVLNPPKKWRRNMEIAANPWRVRHAVKHFKARRNPRGRSAYQAVVAKYLKRGGTMKQAAAAWRKSKNIANPANPYISPYNYRRKAHRGMKIHVKGHKRRDAVRNPVRSYKSVARKYRKNTWTGHKVAHRRAAKKGWLKRFRQNYTYQVAPVVANPMAMTAYLKPLVDIPFLTGTILPITGGFLTSRLVGNKLASLPALQKIPGVLRTIGVPLAVTLAGSFGVGFVTKKADISAKFLAGGLVSIVVSLLEAPGAKLLKLQGLGQADKMTEELKSRISKAIKAEVAKARGTADYFTEEAIPGDTGAGAYLDRESVPTMSDYVSEDSIPLAGPGVGSISLEEFV